MDMKSYPKLRAIETHWIERMGEPALLLQDRLGIAASAIVPRALAPLLALCDGTRDPATISSSLELRTGIRLDMPTVERVLAQLDEAFLLDSDRFVDAYRQALDAYRSVPFRPAALAGSAYPADADELRAMLDRYLATSDNGHGRLHSPRRLRGLVSPHIDYERGGQIYGQVWDGARDALAETDLFVILGTDHMGGPGEISLTRQSFQTPFGVLSTDVEAVDMVAEAMGREAAFRSELNHRAEHSIELASVWLHHLVGERPVQIVPVLCGSFQPFVEGSARPTTDERWNGAASALRRIAERDRTMVIAAADLAHVGPAFGDPRPLSSIDRAALSAADADMLATVCRGDPEGFLDLLTREGDRRRICGLPPIYLALKVLGEATGEMAGYSQCPAPEGSMVSIAGVLLT